MKEQSVKEVEGEEKKDDPRERNGVKSKKRENDQWRPRVGEWKEPRKRSTQREAIVPNTTSRAQLINRLRDEPFFSVFFPSL